MYVPSMMDVLSELWPLLPLWNGEKEGGGKEKGDMDDMEVRDD